jgi:tetratricopeptide (TPR) repeat protein
MSPTPFLIVKARRYGTDRNDVARPHQMAAFSADPDIGQPEAAPEYDSAALAAREAALRGDCETHFLQLRTADPTTSEPLRAALAAAHRALIATVQERANQPWDGIATAGRLAEIGQTLSEAARNAGQIGLGRLSDAMAALRVGRTGPAETILAELSALNTAPADEAARLAFAQGLIAEAALHWPEAARHFAQAARLHPDLRSLQKAREFACMTGDLTGAFRLGTGLMVLAETSGAPEDRAMAMADHALTLEAQDRLPEAEGYLRKAVAAGRSAGIEPGAAQARRLAQLARVLDAQDRFAEAEGPQRKAAELTRTLLGEHHPDYCARLNALGLNLQAQDRDAEAEPLHQKALERSRQLPGGAHPVTIDCLTGLAQLAERQDRLDQAEHYYRQALHLEQTLIGRTHPDFAGRIFALAEVVRAQRRLPEAETLFRKALEIDRATIGEAHRDFGIGLNNLAGVVEAQGRAAEAEGLYAAALAIFRDKLGDLHPATQKVTRNFRALIAAHLPGSVHRPGVEALWTAGQASLPGLAPGN